MIDQSGSVQSMTWLDRIRGWNVFASAPIDRCDYYGQTLWGLRDLQPQSSYGVQVPADNLQKILERKGSSLQDYIDIYRQNTSTITLLQQQIIISTTRRSS